MKTAKAKGMVYKFKINDEVKIDSRYNNKFHRRKGKVAALHGNGYYVKLDGDKNLHYFNYREVVHIKQWIKGEHFHEKTTMQETTRRK